MNERRGTCLVVRLDVRHATGYGIVTSASATNASPSR